MSGYFSRIARAGGARFSGEGVQGTTATKASPTRHLSPIDGEETVMVSPSKPLVPREAGPGTKTIDELTPKPTRRDRSADRTKAVTGLRRIESDAAIPVNPVAEETRLIETRAEARELGTTSVESAGDRNEVTPSSSVRHRPKTSSSDPRTSDATRPEVSEKRFFENTAAIVEGQPAEPAEAQTIVLREVQEWIAAGHIPSAEIVPDDTDHRALPDQHIKPEANELEPGVVRIVDRERPNVSNESADELATRHSIEEQNFEVSIGSISVVVEGEDTLPQAAQPVVTRPAPVQEATRRVSRLSRHYL